MFFMCALLSIISTSTCFTEDNNEMSNRAGKSEGVSESTSHVYALTENPFAGRNNNSNFPWLDDALKDIAYYLRAHKFNEYDRRYKADAATAPREYFRAFPEPPLRSLHWEVHKFCEPSFITCVEYLTRRIREASLRRTDDTTVVIQEQKWDLGRDRKQIDAVQQDCLKMLKVDSALANPFQGPIERFQWRITASYYMCWYTMNEVHDLRHIKESCDNFANCLDPEYGTHNGDPRANDEVPFYCAAYSFCPDPCCTYKHLNKGDDCWSSEGCPCFVSDSNASKECALNRSENTNFADIVLNRWNVTCKCSQMGFRWESKYGLCVDIDECLDGLHGCHPQREACVNLMGSFRCACRWGYVWNSAEGRCDPSAALEIIRIHNIKSTAEIEDKKASSLVKLIFSNLFDSSHANKLAYYWTAPLTASLVSLNILFHLVIKNL